MSDIVIFGAGDIAKLAHFYFSTDSDHNVVGFTVDSQYRSSDEYLGLPLVDFETVAERFPSSKYKMFVALSYAKMNKARSKVCGSEFHNYQSKYHPKQLVAI